MNPAEVYSVHEHPLHLLLHGGSDPTFYYQSWHNHSSGGSTLSYHSADHLDDKSIVDASEVPPAGSQLRSSRVATAKEQFEISCDEDYDEYN